MRTVILEAAKLGLIVGNNVSLKLVDSVGNLTTSMSGYSLNVTLPIVANLFEVNLLQNDLIEHNTHYKITLPNNLSFSFKVPNSASTLPHDLYYLLTVGCVRPNIHLVPPSLDPKFVEKLNLYFTGQNPHFTETQQDIVTFYEYYADHILGSGRTIDMLRLMDEYLATLTGVI